MEPSSSTRGILCEKCLQTHFERLFFRTWMDPEHGFFQYDFTLQDLKSSVSGSSCSWCSLVLQYVEDLTMKVSLAAGKDTCDVSDEDRLSLSDIHDFEAGGTLHLFVIARDWKAALSFTERLMEIWVGSYRDSRIFSVVAAKGEQSN